MFDSESWHDILINTGFETIDSMAPNRFLIFATNLFLASPTVEEKPYLGKLRDYLSHSLRSEYRLFWVVSNVKILKQTLNGIVNIIPLKS